MIKIQKNDFVVDEEINLIKQKNPRIGAISTFIGYVRDINQYKNSYDAFLAFGCIIRGETYHFEIIANECSRKIMDLSISSSKPIGFGILTCENIEQAFKRADINSYNKGKEAAKACLDLLKLN